MYVQLLASCVRNRPYLRNAPPPAAKLCPHPPGAPRRESCYLCYGVVLLICVPFLVGETKRNVWPRATSGGCSHTPWPVHNLWEGVERGVKEVAAEGMRHLLRVAKHLQYQQNASTQLTHTVISGSSFFVQVSVACFVYSFLHSSGYESKTEYHPVVLSRLRICGPVQTKEAPQNLTKNIKCRIVEHSLPA